MVTASIGSTPAERFTSTMVASRGLWNGVTDDYSTASYVDEDETFYAVAVVFAIYFE